MDITKIDVIKWMGRFITFAGVATTGYEPISGGLGILIGTALWSIDFGEKK